MKKRLLALCVASALTAAAGTASAMVKEPTGIGMYNIIPYYSVQSGNATLIAITNTDLENGKAVKVRFRGAEWSDDVFDFTLFLSPGDQWTGAVTQNGLLARMTTTDNSCTLPADINRDFITSRLVVPSDAVEPGPAGVREGYIEIITMADIPETTSTDPATDLYTTIKHVDGVAPCDFGLLASLAPSYNATAEQGMVIPSPSLMSYAITINVPGSKAFAYPGVALNPGTTDNSTNPPVATREAPNTKLFFTQKNVEFVGTVSAVTSDRIFYGTTAGGTGLPIFQFDLPDMTTPATATDAGNPDGQRDGLTDALASPLRGVGVEYVTADEILATTDVVFNQPNRRMYYVYTQSASGAWSVNNDIYDIDGEPLSVYQSLDGPTNRIAVGAPVFFDREEDTVVGETDIVISPTPPSVALTFSLKGEASVISINNGAIPTGSLGASLTANNYETTLANPDGWAILSTSTTEGTPEDPSDDQSLPVIGFTAINAFNSAVAGGTNYGYTLPLRGR